ncbi:hypothetical protein QD357_09380 [Rhizobium sp. BR 317]|uniref:hypothetical protein n=1 Tax=Rhizobium sp. BR 317 TaxID=3040015 RepID=UPI0039BF2E24
MNIVQGVQLGMDKQLVEQHLKLAKQHVAEGRRHITRQKQIIVKLTQGQDDTSQARRLLSTFEELKLMHIAERNRLQKELEAMRL